MGLAPAAQAPDTGPTMRTLAVPRAWGADEKLTELEHGGGRCTPGKRSRGAPGTSIWL